jgi:hypothetical protein
LAICSVIARVDQHRHVALTLLSVLAGVFAEC